MDDAWVAGGLAGKGGGTFRHLSLVPTSFTTYERVREVVDEGVCAGWRVGAGGAPFHCRSHGGAAKQNLAF